MRPPPFGTPAWFIWFAMFGFTLFRISLVMEAPSGDIWDVPSDNPPGDVTVPGEVEDAEPAKVIEAPARSRR